MARTYITSVLLLFNLSSAHTTIAGRPPWDDTKKPSEKKPDNQKPPDKPKST